MKEITLISGKGGTGKTSLAGSFAALSSKAIFTDCDVDAANLSLILRPDIQETHEFIASKIASIRKEDCNRCGLCLELCRFDAISDDYEVDPLSCEGCGFCYYACPEKAIDYTDVVSGEWFISHTPYGPLVHARLGVAEENSGRLVTLVRAKAKEMGRDADLELIITDGPPGIGCPVIASLAGATTALIVTEPSLSGVHDMERVLAVCRHFKVSAGVCINRSDLDEESTQKIEKYCNEQAVPVVGKVPFDKAVTEAMVEGLSVVEYSDGKVSQSIKEIWDVITKL